MPYVVKKKVGYDFDGVVTAGYRPKKGDVIITGRPVERKVETEQEMKKLGVPDVPVHFTSSEKELKDNPKYINEIVGKHKAKWIKKLGIKKFYEDNPAQAAIIKKEVPSVDIVLVKKRYAIRRKK